jgi:hypothetical protein
LVQFGILGLLLELILLEHTESLWQWIPLAALAGGFVAGTLVAVRPSAATLRLFQAVMVLFLGAGLLGLYLHFQGNLAFERETDPSLQGLALYWAALRGATPALAPGALAQLALLGLLYTFRHPSLAEAAPRNPFSRRSHLVQAGTSGPRD